MTHVTVFLVGVGCTALASFCAVAYLTPSLRHILIDLCGTIERADFWTAFFNLSFILMPLIFALHHIPESNPAVPLVYQLSGQVEWALIGLVATVLVVGFVISQFIPRSGGIDTAGQRKLSEAAINDAKPSTDTSGTSCAS